MTGAASIQVATTAMRLREMLIVMLGRAVCLAVLWG